MTYLYARAELTHGSVAARNAQSGGASVATAAVSPPMGHNTHFLEDMQ